MPQVSRKRIVFSASEVNSFPVVPLPSPAQPAGTTSNVMYAQFFDLPFIPSWFRLRNDTPFAVALQFGSDAFRVPAYSIVADILETANPQRGAILIQANTSAAAGLYDLAVQFSDVPGAAGAWSTNPSAGQAGVAPQVQVTNFPDPQDVSVEATSPYSGVGLVSMVGGILATPYSGSRLFLATAAGLSVITANEAMVGTLSNTGTATTGTITVFDGTTTAASPVWSGTLAAGQVLPLGMPCPEGLSVDLASAATIMVSYA